LLPQWQTKTPIFGFVVLPDSFSGTLAVLPFSCGAGSAIVTPP
jgi:hypothetical protein